MVGVEIIRNLLFVFFDEHNAMANGVKDYRGLKVTSGYEPPPNFRFERGVSLGKCEIFGGVAFGMYSYMNSGVVRSSVIVGRYCSIGRNVTLGSGSHDYAAISTSSFFKKNSNPPVIRWADAEKRIRTFIGHDVWIGDNAYIMSGVTVGDGAVVAAGAVVTRDVAPYSIVAGIPARHVKWRFADDVILRLRAVRWHEFDPEILREIDVGNIDLCLSELENLPESVRTEKAIAYRRI